MKFLALLLVLCLPASSFAQVYHHSTDIGTQVPADEVTIPGSIQYDYVKRKIVWGADGTANDITASSPLPVTVSGGGTPSGTSSNPNGSISNNASVGSGSATTFTAPANATGFILENESTTSIPIRWAVGSTASSSVGNYYEAGRDTGVVPIAHNISVIAIGGTASVSVQWLLSQ